MGERQKHGFTYEKQIIEKMGIIPSNDYTSEWDGFLNNIPVSIKLEQYGSDIELADYFRNSKKKSRFLFNCRILGEGKNKYYRGTNSFN